jgi:hypothetical protein
MRKLIFWFLSLGMSLLVKGQTVTLSATNNGMAPIPSFKLGEPAVFVFYKTSLGKKGFLKHIEMSPDLAFNATNGEMWFTDWWLRYNWWSDSLKKWTLTAGFDLPSYFGQKVINIYGEEITQNVIYYTAQLKAKRVLSKKVSVTADYWYLAATKMQYGTKGHYFSVSADWEEKLGEKVLFLANPNVFLLSYSDGTKGWAGSVGASFVHKKTGLFLGGTVLTRITSKQVDFGWSVSFGVTANLFPVL